MKRPSKKWLLGTPIILVAIPDAWLKKIYDFFASFMGQ